MADAQLITILVRREEEPWSAFERRVASVQGETIVVVSAADIPYIPSSEERTSFLEELTKVRYRVRLATRDKDLITAAEERGITVYSKTRTLKQVLAGHPELPQTLRLFSPHLWRQQWRSHLQKIGLLSLPKIRIWILGGVSLLLFLFVVFKLLPSAEVQVTPRQETIDYTTNILLTQSGTVVSAPSHIRTLQLVPFSINIHRSIDFNQISEEFIGTNAVTTLRITNKAEEEYSLKKGTRVTNQAGMVFRLQTSVHIDAGGSETVKAKADPEDQYGQTLGERGNIPAGVRFDFPGLTKEERQLVYAENITPGTGGRTASRKVLQAKDLQIASEQLKTKLLADAQVIAEEKRQAWNLSHPNERLEFLRKDDVIKKVFSGFVVPTGDLGKPLSSITVEGNIIYVPFAYDVAGVLNMVKDDIIVHTVEDKRVILDSLTSDRLRVYIIDYDDNFTWIKITADLLGLQEFILDPLTPAGARFGKRVRETIAGLPKKEAERILRNFNEVERVDLRMWPPWSQSLPTIPSHISIVFPK
jgi:hypothetical protein